MTARTPGSALGAVRSLRRLIPYFGRYRVGLAWGVLTVLATVAVSLAGPQVIRFAIDDLTAAVTGRKLVLYAAVILAIALVEGILRFLMRRILIGISRDIEFDLRNNLFEKLLTLPRTFSDAHPTGDIMNRCSSDVNAVRMLLGPGVMYSINTAAMFTLALFLMIRINPLLTGLVLLPLPVATVVVYFFSRKIHDYYRSVQEYFSDVSVFLQETFSGIRLLRAYGSLDPRQTRFGGMMEQYVVMNRRLIATWGLFYPAMGLLGGLGGVGILYFGGSLVIAGRISLGSFVAFSIYLAMLAWPMMSAGWVLNLIQRGAASMERLNLIFDAVGVEPATGAMSPSTGALDLEFRNLTFSYPGAASPALKAVSVAIPAGSMVGIVGKVGAGKSTLAAVLARVYDPPPGTVMVGGRDVSAIPPGELRRLVAVVPQDPFLFSETIADNIRMGGEDADPESHAAMAGLGADMESFPDRLATLVGERGITLSGGQKQRVTIARALARRAPIILFDDALSSVDVETEAAIIRNIQSLPGRHTLIVISHRISSIRDADLILAMMDGEIVEAGTHTDLIGRNGLYASLFRKEEIEAELATL